MQNYEAITGPDIPKRKLTTIIYFEIWKEEHRDKLFNPIECIEENSLAS